MILSDKWFKENKHVIQPFIDQQVSEGCISYGLSSFGYDIRCSDEFKVFESYHHIPYNLIDPKNIKTTLNNRSAVVAEGYTVLPAHSFCLTHSVETIEVPDDVLVLCIGKSTYARCGLIVNTTPLEPGWKGQITLELSNTTDLPIKIYADEGIAQLLFIKGDQVPDVTYSDRKGKYMGQVGITLPRC